jgi:hypothetical protein
MAKAKNTTTIGREHEDYITSIFDWDSAGRSRSSGASFHDPADITSDNLVIECEATEAASYRLTLEFWREALGKAHTGKLPALAVRFRDSDRGRHTDLVVMDAHDISMILEELEAYRTAAITQ